MRKLENIKCLRNKSKVSCTQQSYTQWHTGSLRHMVSCIVPYYEEMLLRTQYYEASHNMVVNRQDPRVFT